MFTTGYSTYFLSAGLLLAAAAFLTACKTSEPTVQSCHELGAALASDSGTTQLHFRVIRPDGGEVYHVGDTLRVRVTGNLNQSNAQVKLFVGLPGNLSNDVVPGSTGSRNVFQDCDIAFEIPAVLGSGAIPLVSDFVRIRVEGYSDPSRSDFSDNYFSIRP